MIGYEFWRDRTGRVWAVKLVAGDVTGACGPLAGAQVDASRLPTYDYDDVAGARIQRQREHFLPVSELELILLSAETD